MLPIQENAYRVMISCWTRVAMAILVLGACSEQADPAINVEGAPVGGGPAEGTQASTIAPRAVGETSSPVDVDSDEGPNGSVGIGVDASATSPPVIAMEAPDGTNGDMETPAMEVTAMEVTDTVATGTDAATEQAACTRDLLASTVDAYFTALAANDASPLPVADDVKFTENGQALGLGDGLWQDAGAVTYRHRALDTERCQAASEAVVPAGGTDVPVALRLRLAGQKITEIETIVARPGDYVIFGSAFESEPAAIIASAALGWEEPVPEAERASRAEIEAWVMRYFEHFPGGGCNLADDCLRLENGGGSFSCSLGASCSDSSGGFGGPLDARLVLVDDVTGVGVGFTMFMGNTDMHMVMMRNGEIRAVHAILSAADQSGWE